MKNTIISSNTKRTGLFSEKFLLVFCAGLSLAFGLFYTFSQIETQAHSVELAEIQSAPVIVESVAPATSVADVVTKALAFKASLTTTQQATLEKAYTPALARRWSNLPCGANCRNGIQFSTLTAAQLNLALQVIQASMGTTANEGSDEFNQVRLADAFLGANGGGSGYSSGIYFIAFLNTPTTTGGWMLQFGGHHYGANIAFNQGHYVGVTPLFEAIEPTTFTVSGTTYTPLEQERTALRNMLASLTTAQLTTARLTQTFGDVTMAPGESNGGNGTFPTTKVGIQVGTLSSAQQLLVLEALKPWVKDLEDSVAANLLAIYQNELNGTYIAYTGNGTSGNPTSFLTANTNYARIDGQTAWVEFVCQNGVVLSGIHYHSVYRDRVRDYGADLSLTTPLETTTTVKSRADFDGDGKTDLSVFRPSEGVWYLNRSTSGFTATNWGVSTDVPTPGDFDGDNKTDTAIFRPSNGTWYVLRSSDSTASIVNFGANGDVPVAGDYDGDGKADYAVFRSTTNVWYILNSGGTTSITPYGVTGDVPVRADYNGDGKTDIAIFRPSTGQWWISNSGSTETVTSFGISTDKPVPADYDGDNKEDICVYRNGIWYILRSLDGSVSIVNFGLSTDIPVPGDYDGDGKDDQAIYRNGTWWLNQSTSGVASAPFGSSTDMAIPSRYIP